MLNLVHRFNIDANFRPLMEKVTAFFEHYPSQEAVAMLLLRLGISVHDGFAYCGDIRQSDVAIARAAHVDRRVVRSTIEKIEQTPGLLALFSKLRCMLLLSDAAPELGCTALEIVPTDAAMPGILAGIADVLYKAGLSVRQAVVSDPGEQCDSHLMVIVDGKIPGDTLSAIRQSRGVASVTLR